MYDDKLSFTDILIIIIILLTLASIPVMYFTFDAEKVIQFLLTM